MWRRQTMQASYHVRAAGLQSLMARRRSQRFDHLLQHGNDFAAAGEGREAERSHAATGTRAAVLLQGG